ncbi:MAG TPA: ROK family protein [Acidimicrobiia bacterium]|jgi:glucokinase|nr:ROK family protein [Acidimicrobiia bacterium]
MNVIAVDIGGTKLDTGLVNERGDILERVKAATPTTDDPEALFDALIALLDQLPIREGAAVGVGCGGPMNSRGVSPLNIPAWREFPLAVKLHARLGLPVWIDNDAKALALGEGWLGAARGVDNYIAMVVSTGVGGGIVCDGRLLDGAEGNAGHVGHMIVEPDGHVCGCGARGCVEAEASGTAIERITGRPAREASAEVIARTGTMVGRAVASVANLLDLQLAVISGSVALGFGEPFFVAAQAEIDARACLDFSRGTRVVPGGLGPDGPLLGAARVALVRL